MAKRIQILSGAAALQQEGLSESPEVWEDGQRLPRRPGFFERWQFNARLDDGTILLVTFFSKPMLDRTAEARPGFAITLIPPNARRIVQAVQIEPNEYSSSADHCYVRAGRSWVRGDRDWNYELDVQAPILGAHLNFQSLLPPWRPGTGKFAADGQAGSFGWLAALPSARVSGVVTVNGKMSPVSGYGYHDHRWGNLDLSQAFSHWYIGQAFGNDLSLVFLEVTTSPGYGQSKLSALMLARGGKILAEGTQPVDLVEQDYVPDESGRSYPQALKGCWESDPARVDLHLRNPVALDYFSLVDFLPTFHRLVGGLLNNPYHFTFTADLDLAITIAGQPARIEIPALYELALLR